MKIFCTGTLGDTYIICLKLLKLDSEPITVYHNTSHMNWYSDIKQIYSLLKNVEVTFVDEPRNDLILIESTFRYIDTEFFPVFGTIESRYKIEKPYFVLQPHSGKLNGGNTKELLPQYVQRIIDENEAKYVLLGTNDLYANIKNCTNMINATTILEAIDIVRRSDYFIGPEGLLSFVALSHKINSTVFYSSFEAVNLRILNTPWEEYTTLISMR